ncbi:Leucine-rich repeat, partial [Trinorchestia longiramus]
SIGETNFFLGSRMENNSNVLLPPNVTGLCPEPGPENGLDPCTCTNNGGSLGGTINIFCPPEVSSQAILKDIIQRTTFFTTDVNSPANNDISYFHFGAVSSEEAPYLQYLNISGNDLQFLPQDAFVNPQLESVSISNNRIYTISQHCFSGLINSRLIDVSSNYLSDLQSNSFSIAGHSTSSVLQINMSNNSIRYIPPDVFGDLIDVYVNLSDNLLTELDEAVFRPIIVNSKFFAYFQVDGNPIKCNCDIFWIVNNSQIMECFDNFHCAASDQTLYQLTPQDMPEC